MPWGLPRRALGSRARPRRCVGARTRGTARCGNLVALALYVSFANLIKTDHQAYEKDACDDEPDCETTAGVLYIRMGDGMMMRDGTMRLGARVSRRPRTFFGCPNSLCFIRCKVELVGPAKHGLSLPSLPLLPMTTRLTWL